MSFTALNRVMASASQKTGENPDCGYAVDTQPHQKYLNPFEMSGAGGETRTHDLDALESLHTGLLRLTILRADVGPDDAVRSAEFKAEFIAPNLFQFDSSLASHPMTCPASTMPISEQLPARIPPAEPAKFQGVQDAADWKNPYLVVTRDGFDVRFQGGRLSGPLSILARTLVGLPDSAWPYGRVVAGSENGVLAIGDAPTIKRNKEQADKILREVGLEVQWWPSA